MHKLQFEIVESSRANRLILLHLVLYTTQAQTQPAGIVVSEEVGSMYDVEIN